MIIQGLLTFVGLLAAAGCGWALRGRRPDVIDAESSSADSTAAINAAKRAAEDGLVEQLLEANDSLHQQLAQAEQRLRELRMIAAAAADHVTGDDEPAGVDSHQDDPAAIAADQPVGAVDDVNASATDGEQRAHERRRLMQDVLLAPYVEGAFPSDAEFHIVKGYDVSAGGIAFFLSNPPTHDDYVVVLGNDLHPIYIKAHVVRVAKKHMYLVGCRFVGRLEPPSNRSNGSTPPVSLRKKDRPVEATAGI